MSFDYGQLTYIPYRLIDHGHVQDMPNSVLKESPFAQIDSIFDHFELLVTGFDHLHAGEHVVQPLDLVDAGG
jgi:hypothetical protein